jgi:DNA-binding transcriptional MerR regulator
MVSQGEYTTPQVAKILDIPQRKIISYTEREYVEPSIQNASGHGSRRLWNLWDLDKIHVIRKCEKLGLSVEGLRTLGKTLSPPFWPEALTRIREHPWFVMNEYGDVGPPEERLEDQIRRIGTPCVVIAWADIATEVQGMIKKTGLR